MLHLGKASPKSLIELWNKSPSDRGGTPPFECLVREAPEVPQTIKALAFPFKKGFIYVFKSFVFMYVYHICAWCPQNPEEAPLSSATGLQMAMSQPVLGCVGAWNQDWVLCKRSKYS